ncbi:restriction endonuclease subunit S [bacterium]|nr:restriction endonuclease subunit S [bacterium]
MRNGWERKRLQDFAETISTGPFGSVLHKSDYADHGVPLVNPINIIDDRIVPDPSKLITEPTKQRLSNYVLREGDIVVGRRGEIGRCAVVGLAEVGWVCGTGSFFIRPLPSVDSRFIAHLIRSSDYREKLEQLSTGTTMKNLSNIALADLVVAIPSLREQRRIVGILDEAFAGIATAKANAEKNLQNARALFESHLHSVFNQNGENWVVATLDTLSTNLDSNRVPITKCDRKSGEYPYYGASGIVDYVADYIYEGDTLLVSEDGANLLARSTPIAFSVSGKYWVNNHAHILKFEHMATQRFVEFFLESIKLDEYITGAAQPKLNQKAMNSIPIPIPKAIGEQKKIVGDIESFAAETQRLESIYQRKLAALEALKKSLLHQAFNGEL